MCRDLFGWYVSTVCCWNPWVKRIHREKINQSILTLWVTRVSVGIQSITLDLLCNYALLNVGIQTLHNKVCLSDFLVIVYHLFKGRMVTDYGFIAFLNFFPGDNWPLDQVFWLWRGFEGVSERCVSPRKIFHKEHASLCKVNPV